ncbi:capsid assembly protein [Azospirillum sp. sgz301742]
MRALNFMLLATAVLHQGEEGGGGAPAGGGTAVAERPVADAHAGVSVAAPVEKPAAAPEVVRPDYIPEKFWDAERRAPRVEDLGKSYVELERRHHMRSDDLRKTVEEEVKGGLFKDRPASADQYVLAPPKGFLPEGLEFQGNADDPLFKTFTQIAHARGLSQDEFSQCVGAYLESLAMQVPDPAAEIKVLGAKARERIDGTKLWAEANIPKEHLTFVGAQIAQTAAGIQFLEWMKEQMGEPRLGDLSISGTSQGDGTLSAEQLTAMQSDPRYYDPMKRDPAFVNRIEQGWKVLSLRQQKGGRR